MEWEGARGERDNECVSFDKYVKINDATNMCSSFSGDIPAREASKLKIN